MWGVLEGGPVFEPRRFTHFRDKSILDVCFGPSHTTILVKNFVSKPQKKKKLFLTAHSVPTLNRETKPKSGALDSPQRDWFDFFFSFLLFQSLSLSIFVVVVVVIGKTETRSTSLLKVGSWEGSHRGERTNRNPTIAPHWDHQDPRRRTSHGRSLRFATFPLSSQSHSRSDHSRSQQITSDQIEWSELQTD